MFRRKKKTDKDINELDDELQEENEFSDEYTDEFSDDFNYDDDDFFGLDDELPSEKLNKCKKLRKSIM